MKKYLSILIAAAMLVAMLPATLFSAFAAEPTAITTADQLKAAANGDYKLGNDIDLGGAELTEALATLQGTLDGNGHSILNFSLKLTGNKVSLFAQSGELTIKNLTIGSESAPIAVTGAPKEAAATDSIGVLLSEIIANAAFENVCIYANANCSSVRLGGFIGLYDTQDSLTVSLKNCVMNGKLEANINRGNFGVAGFIGNMTGKGSVTFEGCINNATVAQTSEKDGDCAAGFVAFVNTSGTLSVVNCINKGSITNKISLAGGLFGYLYVGATTVNGYWNNGDITVTKLFAGSVFGRKRSDMTLENILNSGDIISTDNFYGAIGGHNSAGSLTVKNLLTYGRARYGTCAGNAPSPIENAFYYGTYGEAATGMTALENNDAVFAKVNSEGFMDAFRAKFGNFDKSFMEMDNETLDPNRKIPTEVPSLVEDSPFTKYIPGYILHHMDFSKVGSFAESGYFITKDGVPTVFKVENNTLKLDTESGKQVFVAFTGNGIPKNISDLTMIIEASFSDLRGGYFSMISSLQLNEDGSKNKIVDIAVRDGKNAGAFPLPDGCEYGPAEYANGTLKETSKQNWAKIGEKMAAGEKMSFMVSYKDNKVDKIVISSGDVSVELICTGNNSTRDMGSYLGFIVKDVQVAVYDVKVIAGSVNDYTTVTWPVNENDLVNAVSPSAVAPDDDDDNNGEDETKPNDTTDSQKPTDTTGTTEPPKKGGCASAVSGSLAVLAIFAAAGVMLGKKHH